MPLLILPVIDVTNLWANTYYGLHFPCEVTPIGHLNLPFVSAQIHEQITIRYDIADHSIHQGH